ncbi:MAG: POTRA domain-containing protein [Gemmataceae bacterium]
MAKRWIVGGIWAILMSAGVLMCGWCATAEHPRKMPNTVRKVTFLGAKHVKEEELRNLTGVRKGMMLNPNLNRQGCQRILGKYAEMGRTFADCQLIKGGDLDDTEVVYQITEGPKIKVRDIQFVGNTFVSSARLATQVESLREWFRLRSGTYHKQAAEFGVTGLERYYRDFGYQDVRVSLETKQSAYGHEMILIYHIQEGPRYRAADKAELRVPESLRGECLEDLVKLGKGDYLTTKAIHADVKCLRDYCKSIHRFVSVEAIPVWIPDSPGVCNVRYEVVEHTRRIGKIHVTGNKLISSESILAHVPLVPGNVLSYSDLQQAEQNLAELGLFVVDAATGVRPTVTVIDAEGDSDQKDLLITVKEKAKAKGKKSKHSR